MSQDDEFSISEMRRKRERLHAAAHGGSAGSSDSIIHAAAIPRAGSPAGPRRRSRPTDEDDEKSEWSVDIWRVLAALKRRWQWLVLAVVILSCAGFGAGYFIGTYSVSIKLIPTGVSGVSETFRPEALSPKTLVALVKSPELIRRVASKAEPPIEPNDLDHALWVGFENESELMIVTLQGKNIPDLVKLANLYGQETVDYTRGLQLSAAQRMSRFYREKVERFDQELRRVNSEMTGFLATNKIINPEVESESYLEQLGDMLGQINSKSIEADLAVVQIEELEKEAALQNPHSDQLGAARARLATLRSRFTDQHPAVQDALAEITALEAQMHSSGTNATATPSFVAGSLGSSLQKQIVELRIRSVTLLREVEELQKKRHELQNTVSGLSEKGLTYAGIKAELDSLQKTRGIMAISLREAQLFEENAQGYYRMLNPLTSDDVNTRPRLTKAMTTSVKGGLAGLLVAAALVFLVEMKDRTMKTVAEVERVTKLPVLATLGDLNDMSPAEQDKWAFRTWTILAGQLSMSANHGMVCGIMSSVHGEGRSTWIRLLGSAAGQRGLRVLTVATKPSGADDPANEARTEANEKSFTDAVAHAMAENEHVEDGDKRKRGRKKAAEQETATLSPSALAFPAEVTQKFAEGGLPAAHIPLPGWVWNLERRRQWQLALAHWRAVDNLVLLVELPPASVPEAVLLAESLPQILWLVDSGKPQIRETKEQLEMLHHAKCRIVGAVLNHEPEPIIKL